MADTLAPELPVLNRKDFTSDQDVRWCPGCGDYAILAQVQKVLPDLGQKKEDIVFISGIGCSSRFPYYVDTYGIHSIHGRAPTLASGLKLARPELTVFVITGDGDALSIGGNHLLHVLRRNVDVNIILFNNRIYGLTKGQFSPTSLPGHKTKSSPMGSIAQPLNPLSVALAAEATFAARSVDVETKHLQAILKEAAAHRGASFIEVFQNCNIFNDGAWRHVTDPKNKKDNTLLLEHGKPMVFGAQRDRGLRFNGPKLEVVKLGEGVTESDLAVHDSQDEALAYALSRLTPPNFPVPIGVFRTISKPTYETAMMGQVEAAEAHKGEGDLRKLFFAADLWTVTEEGSQKTPPPNGKSRNDTDDRFEEMLAGWADSLSPLQHDLARIPVSDLSPYEPITGTRETPLSVAVGKMRQNQLNCCLVCDQGGKVEGIFTDRDILRVALLVEDLSQVTLGQCMWHNPAVLDDSLPIARALHAFTVQEVRYLPLVDSEGKPTGIITTRQVMEFIKKRLQEA